MKILLLSHLFTIFLISLLCKVPIGFASDASGADDLLAHHEVNIYDYSGNTIYVGTIWDAIIDHYAWRSDVDFGAGGITRLLKVSTTGITGNGRVVVEIIAVLTEFVSETTKLNISFNYCCASDVKMAQQGTPPDSHAFASLRRGVG